MTIGAIAIMVEALTAPIAVPCCVTRLEMATGSVWRPARQHEYEQELVPALETKESTAAAPMPGKEAGMTTCQNTVNGPAPSITAASSSSFGTRLKKLIISQTT